jgi:histone H3/H4
MHAAASSGNNQEIKTMTDKKEVLVVASKVKTYIREKSEMNTSAGVFDILSDKIRDLCDRAIENARNDGRKTVKDRDFS